MARRNDLGLNISAWLQQEETRRVFQAMSKRLREITEELLDLRLGGQSATVEAVGAKQIELSAEREGLLYFLNKEWMKDIPSNKEKDSDSDDYYEDQSAS